MGRFTMFDSDRSLANKRFKQVMDACEKQESNTLRSLLSPKVINETSDIDNTISELFDFVQGKLVSFNDWGGVGTEAGKNDDGSGRTWKKIHATYDFETSEDKYRLAMEIIVRDTEKPENIGISSVYIIKAEDSDLEFAYGGDGNWTLGINIIKNANPNPES